MKSLIAALSMLTLTSALAQETIIRCENKESHEHIFLFIHQENSWITNVHLAHNFNHAYLGCQGGSLYPLDVHGGTLRCAGYWNHDQNNWTGEQIGVVELTLENENGKISGSFMDDYMSDDPKAPQLRTLECGKAE